MYPSVAAKLLPTQIIIAFLFFACCYAATQLPLPELALQVHQERTQVVFVCLFVQ